MNTQSIFVHVQNITGKTSMRINGTYIYTDTKQGHTQSVDTTLKGRELHPVLS